MSVLGRIQITEKVRLSADKYGPANPQQLKQLTFVFKKALPREVFFGLFSFFYDQSLQENIYHRQQLAGMLLFEVCPECPLELDGCVYAAAQHWNFSVEELPLYFCKTFGSTTVISFLDELITASDEKLARSLKTMSYWSKGYKKIIQE